MKNAINTVTISLSDYEEMKSENDKLKQLVKENTVYVYTDILYNGLRHYTYKYDNIKDYETAGSLLEKIKSECLLLDGKIELYVKTKQEALEKTNGYEKEIREYKESLEKTKEMLLERNRILGRIPNFIINFFK